MVVIRARAALVVQLTLINRPGAGVGKHNNSRHHHHHHHRRHPTTTTSAKGFVHLQYTHAYTSRTALGHVLISELIKALSGLRWKREDEGGRE